MSKYSALNANFGLLNRRRVIAGAVGLIAQFKAADAAVTDDAVLRAESPLGDIILGNSDAPLALVEFTSASCPFSAKFQAEVLPEIKSKYIENGKLKLVFRELPPNPRLIAVTMLARCLPRERYFDAYTALFQNQGAWVKIQDPGPDITRIMTDLGMNKVTFDQCLADGAKAAQLNAFTRKTVRDFRIEATPTFFLNGRKIFGRKDMAELRSELITAIDAALKV